ncbi:MAG: M1 family aminopeptidase [Bryobacteraceae bacterium]
MALVAPGLLWPAEPIPALARQLRTAGLDPDECYRVREVHFTRGDDLRFYFIDGFLIFGKPIGGRRISAVFTTAPETGDAELLVMPPSKGERTSLAAFTSAPNLDEHVRAAVLLFTDDSAETLKKAIESRGDVQKAPERGQLLAEEWNQAVANMSSSFAVRLIYHLTSGVQPGRGLFYTAVQGVKLGNFDAVYDPDAENQIYLGQLKYKEERAFYDTWTAFPAGPFRRGRAKRAPADLAISNYRIEAALDSELVLHATSTVSAKPSRDGMRVFALDISEGMSVKSAKVDGKSAEVFAGDSFRSDLIRRAGSTQFFVVTPEPLDGSREHEFAFEHEGKVVRNAGRDVYYVGSRANWYPRAGPEFSRFDIRFRFPAHLDLVFAGELKEESSEGAFRIVRRVTPVPVRMAGFNLGRYQKFHAERGGLNVDVYANRLPEYALSNPRDTVNLPPMPPFPPRPGARRLPNTDTLHIPTFTAPDPTARLRALAEEIASGMEFLSKSLGPPALPDLMVSPIPGAFGQGFPGLVYLSTLSYLDPRQRPLPVRSDQQEVFFSEILHAHETAHQWWGNVVMADTLSDEWLMEALANYSALMILEKKKGPKAMQSALANYRDRLFGKIEDDRIVDSSGPIRLGRRVSSSQSPDAWQHIIYGKGSWILHMLRARMGDASFLKMLGDVCREYRNRPITTEQFQAIAARYLPKGYADAFFDHWVESTGIPEVTMAQQYRAGKLSITVKQAGVDESVTLHVPVVVQPARGKAQTHWVVTGSDPVTMTLAMPAPPLKVALDPDGTLLRK